MEEGSLKMVNLIYEEGEGLFSRITSRLGSILSTAGSVNYKAVPVQNSDMLTGTSILNDREHDIARRKRQTFIYGGS